MCVCLCVSAHDCCSRNVWSVWPKAGAKAETTYTEASLNDIRKSFCEHEPNAQWKSLLLLPFTHSIILKFNLINNSFSMSQIYISYDVRVGIMILLQCFSQSRVSVCCCAHWTSWLLSVALSFGCAPFPFFCSLLPFTFYWITNKRNDESVRTELKVNC